MKTRAVNFRRVAFRPWLFFVFEHGSQLGPQVAAALMTMRCCRVVDGSFQDLFLGPGNR